MFGGGVVLDLSAMKALDLDPQRRTAWAQTGLTAGQYTVVAAAHGLATGASRRTARNQRIVRIAEADVADEPHRRYCHHPPVGTTRQPLRDRP